MCYNYFMRFQAYFTPIIKILLYIMAALSFVALVIGVLRLANVPIELSQGQAILIVSVCPMSVLITLLFATLHYKVTATHLRLYIGFIDILGGRIRLDKILNIVIDRNTMYISYLHQGMDPIIAAIAINPKNYDKMKNILTARNPNIQFYKNHNEPDNSKQ